MALGLVSRGGVAVSLAAKVWDFAPTIAPVYDSAPVELALDFTGVGAGVAGVDDDGRFSDVKYPPETERR